MDVVSAVAIVSAQNQIFQPTNIATARPTRLL